MSCALTPITVGAKRPGFNVNGLVVGAPRPSTWFYCSTGVFVLPDVLKPPTWVVDQFVMSLREQGDEEALEALLGTEGGSGHGA